MSRRAKVTPDAAGISERHQPTGRRAAPQRGRDPRRRQRRVLRQARARRDRRRIRLRPRRHRPRPAARRHRARAPVRPRPRRRRHPFVGSCPPSRRRQPAAPRPSLQWALSAITDGVAFVRDQHQDLLATNALGRAFYSPAHRRRRTHPEPRPVPVPRPRLPRLLPRLGPVRRDVRRDHARRGRPRPARQGPAGPRRRTLHPQRRLPTALGRTQRAHPRCRHEAVPPPDRRRADPRVRGARHHRRTRPGPAGLHRRAGSPSAERLRLLASWSTPQVVESPS